MLRDILRSLVWSSVSSAASAKEKEFSLPPGDAERGQAAFVQFRCFDCHLVNGVELPPGEEQDQVMVNLGGQVKR